MNELSGRSQAKMQEKNEHTSLSVCTERAHLALYVANFMEWEKEMFFSSVELWPYTREELDKGNHNCGFFFLWGG